MAVAIEGGVGAWIAVAVLVGRIAAIAGILMRSQTGWYLALGFFAVIIALNALAASHGMNTVRALAGLVVPVGCAVYLLIARDEFDR